MKSKVYDRNDCVFHIEDYLPTGRENAITGKELASHFNCDVRTITAAIERERRDGAPICADPQRGFYLAANKKEMQEYCDWISLRIHAMIQTSWACEGIADRMPE